MNKRTRRRRNSNIFGLVTLTVLIITLAVIVLARWNLDRHEQVLPIIEVAEPAPAEKTPAPIPTPEMTEAPQEEEPTDATPLISTVDDGIAPENRPARVARYAGIAITEEEGWELAKVVYLEAGNQSFEGQQAVVEVVLNRVVHPAFPNTVYEVLHQGEGTNVPQFSSIRNLDQASVTEDALDAINAALYGETILPADVVFFSQKGENSRVWGKIGDHVFCYEYIWG